MLLFFPLLISHSTVLAFFLHLALFDLIDLVFSTFSIFSDLAFFCFVLQVVRSSAWPLCEMFDPDVQCSLKLVTEVADVVSLTAQIFSVVSVAISHPYRHLAILPTSNPSVRTKTHWSRLIHQANHPFTQALGQSVSNWAISLAIHLSIHPSN